MYRFTERLARRVTTALILTAAPLMSQLPNTGASVSAGQDNNWSVTARNINTNSIAYQGPAFTMSSIPDGVWQPNTATFNWISARPSGSLGSGNFEYLFSTVVTPASDKMLVSLGWDNTLLGAFLNGTINGNGELIGATQLLGPQSGYGFCRDGDGALSSSSYPNCTLELMLDGLPTNQPATITFVIRGDGGTDGLMISSSQSVVPEPASMVLLGTGLAGLGVAARRRRVA